MEKRTKFFYCKLLHQKGIDKCRFWKIVEFIFLNFAKPKEFYLGNKTEIKTGHGQREKEEKEIKSRSSHSRQETFSKPKLVKEVKLLIVISNVSFLFFKVSLFFPSYILWFSSQISHIWNSSFTIPSVFSADYILLLFFFFCLCAS